MRTLIRNAAKAYENQEDYDAMSEIMWCGSISHNGITGLGRPKDFLCHKLGHQLGAKFDEATVQHYLQSGEAGRDTSIIWTRQDLQITEEKYGTLMRKMMKKRLWQRLRKLKNSSGLCICRLVWEI